MLDCICWCFCIDVITQKHLGLVFSWQHQVQPHNLYLQLEDSTLFWETSWMYANHADTFIFSRLEFSPDLLYESYDASTINDLHLSCIVMLLQAVSMCCGKDDVLRLQGTALPPLTQPVVSAETGRIRNQKHLWHSLSIFICRKEDERLWDLFGFTRQPDLRTDILLFLFFLWVLVSAEPFYSPGEHSGDDLSWDLTITTVMNSIESKCSWITRYLHNKHKLSLQNYTVWYCSFANNRII